MSAQKTFANLGQSRAALAELFEDLLVLGLREIAPLSLRASDASLLSRANTPAPSS
jgi:hypothetical protein